MDCIAGALQCKEAGNKALGASKAEAAIGLYIEGLQALNEGTLLASLLLNMSAAFLHQGHNSDAFFCGAAALLLYPERGTAPQKACYRIAKAAFALGHAGVALSALHHVPNSQQSKEVKALKDRLEAATEAHHVGGTEGMAVTLVCEAMRLRFAYAPPPGAAAAAARESGDDCIATARALKGQGNDAWAASDPGRACELWHVALQRLHPAPALLGNLAIAHMKRKQYAAAVQAAAAALVWDGRAEKPLYRLLKAATEQGYTHQAFALLKHRMDTEQLPDAADASHWKELLSYMTSTLVENTERAEAGGAAPAMMTEKELRKWTAEGEETAAEALAARRELEARWRVQPAQRQQCTYIYGPPPPQYDEPYYTKRGVPRGTDAATAKAGRDVLSHTASQCFSDYMKLVNRGMIAHVRKHGGELTGLTATLDDRFNVYEGARRPRRPNLRLPWGVPCSVLASTCAAGCLCRIGGMRVCRACTASPQPAYKHMYVFLPYCSVCSCSPARR